MPASAATWPAASAIPRDARARATAFSYPFGEPGGSGNDPRTAAELPALLREAGFARRSWARRPDRPRGRVDGAFTALGARPDRRPRHHVDGRAADDDPRRRPPRRRAACRVAVDERPGGCRRRGSDLLVSGHAYGGCRLSGVNTQPVDGLPGDHGGLRIDPRTSALIAVRDGAGAGTGPRRGRHRRRVLLARRQFGNGRPWCSAAADRLAHRGPGRRIEVRGARLTVAVAGAAPLRAAIDTRLGRGARLRDRDTGPAHAHLSRTDVRPAPRGLTDSTETDASTNPSRPSADGAGRRVRLRRVRRRGARAAATGTVVSLTFDDGARDQYDNAFPLLAEHGTPATFFVNSARVDAPGYMTRARLSRWVRRARDRQAHRRTPTCPPCPPRSRGGGSAATASRC